MFLLSGTITFAQTTNWQDIHKIKRKETIYGICKQYGITEEELVKANPEMKQPGYELRKGDYIYIPYPSKNNQQTVAKTTNNVSKATGLYSNKSFKVGIVLPLHNVDGDGKRMVEYYRGLLMAFDDLKKQGMSIEVNAVNTPIDGDIYQSISQKGMSKCDIIFGPLYSKQVKPLADFAYNNGAKLVIPFSITGNDAAYNPIIYQVYQSPEYLNNSVIKHFAYRFSNYHIVVIDCNDKTSDKGTFTFGLRSELEKRNIPYSITNLNSSNEMFAKSFSSTKPNMVILNTGRSPELNQVIAKLDVLTSSHPELAISMFGYTEWLMYAKYNTSKFCKYDTFIPTCSYYNTYSSKTKAFENEYRKWFNSEPMDYIPRFAITGYDHGMFFLRGLAEHGKNFTGATADKDALQTPLHFIKADTNGGYQNSSFMFVHYNRNNTISTINF